MKTIAEDYKEFVKVTSRRELRYDHNGEKCKLICIGVMLNDYEDGEEQLITYTIRNEDGNMQELDENKVLELLEQYGLPIEGTRCTHEYDCCGSFYADRMRYVGKGWHTMVFEQMWRQNV